MKSIKKIALAALLLPAVPMIAQQETGKLKPSAREIEAPAADRSDLRELNAEALGRVKRNTTREDVQTQPVRARERKYLTPENPVRIREEKKKGKRL